MLNGQYSRLISKVILVFIAVLALMSPALINGFPLVYSDTGTYIAAAKTHSIPVDRPIAYSLFLNLTSLNISLWFTIIVQCIILFYLIYLLFEKVFQIRHSLRWSVGSIVFLSFTTSVSNYSSQLMPDIFVSWMLLSVFIFIFQKENKLFSDLFLTLIFIISVTGHFSVLFAATIIITFLVAGIFILKPIPLKRNYLLISWLIIGWLTIPAINSAYGAGFSVSRCKNVSLMARLVETGIVREYLQENCTTEKYSLCQYQDSLPQYGYMFAWEPSSPLYKGPCWATGWGNCWIEKDREYGVLIHDILTDMKYVKKLAKISTKDTYRQLIDFNIGVLVPMNEQSAPYGTIKTFYPQNLKAYTRAKQFHRILYFSFLSKIQKVLVILTLLILPILLFSLRRYKNVFIRFYLISVTIIAGLVINAAVCSTLSTVVDRYQSRVIWLIPFLMVIAVPVIISLRSKTHHSEKV